MEAQIMRKQIMNRMAINMLAVVLGVTAGLVLTDGMTFQSNEQLSINRPSAQHINDLIAKSDLIIVARHPEAIGFGSFMGYDEFGDTLSLEEYKTRLLERLSSYPKRSLGSKLDSRAVY
jgi:hypothetical protein